MELTQKDIKRFWDKVQKEPGDSCWNWQAGLDREGYGRFGKSQKSILAHRVSYQLHNGVEPGSLLVLHSCDNPACVNPAHLILGTYLDNNRDRANKGRSAHILGESHGNHKLTEKEVIQIRRLYAAGGTSHRRLARVFNVAPVTINRVVNSDTWGHIS